MKIDYAVIGERIRRYRKLKQLTQEQLAERVDLSPVYIRYIETAKRTARLDTYVQIVNELGCTMDYLLRDYQIHDKRGRYLDNLLEDCSEREIEQITAMVAQLKQVLRQ